MKQETITERNGEIKSINENYEVIGCPYCNSTNAIKFRAAADIVKCLNCETVYLRTRLKKEAMQKLYLSYNTDAPQMFLPKNDSEIKTSVLRRDYWMKEILSYTKTKGNCLDIGCGWGAFLDNARSYGFNPRGIEITKKGADFAKSKLKINATSEQFLETHFENNSFTFVTLNHVLEHLPEPKEAIKKIFEILEPGGMFCGIVPNVNSLCSIFLKESWEWLDADYHYVHYSPASLKQHLQKAGFVIEKIYTASGDYNRQHLSQVINAFYRPQNNSLIPEITSKIENDGAGEEIRFLVRKPFTVSEEPELKRIRINSEARKFNSYKASIIIPVYNKVEYTQKCLETLYTIDNGVNNFEVIVVDNASSDDTEKFLVYASGMYSDLKILRNSKNLRYAGACNAGAAAAEGEYLIFLNNDTVPTEKWLSEGLVPLITNSQVGIVGSKLLYADRTIQHAGVQFIGNMHTKYELWPSHRFLGLSEDEPLANIAEPVDAVTGACLFISKKIFDKVNGFNEEYQMYFEDSDLCFKVTAAGKKVFYQPKSVVIHYEGKSNNDESHRHSQNQKAAEIFYSNWNSFINKMSLERSGAKINISNLSYSDLLIVQRLESSKHLANIFLRNSRFEEAENILRQILKAAPKYQGVAEILHTIDNLKNHKPADNNIQYDRVENSLRHNTVQKNKFPEVSIIVPVYNNIRYTKEFVDSLFSSTEVQLELIIVDNASTDETPEFLAQLKNTKADIKIISNKENLGFPASINQGILNAAANYILIANNDIVLTSGWLERIIEVAESDNKIGIVGPISNEVSGLQKDTQANYNSIDDMHRYASLVKEKNKNEVMEFPRVAFLCTLIKKEVIEKIGGLDERFSPGNYEDDDFCLRAQLNGFKTVIAKDVFIHHYGSKSFKANGEIEYAARLEVNKKIFIEKWGASPDDIWIKGSAFNHTKNLLVPINANRFIQYFDNARLLISEKEYKLALENLEKAIQNYNTTQSDNSIPLTDVYNLAANISLFVNDLDSAQKYFEEELKLNPNSSSACFGLGEVFWSVENFDTAKTMYEYAVANDAENLKAQSKLEEVNLILGLTRKHNTLFIEIPE